MQFRFERAITGAVARRQRFVEDHNGAARIARCSFSLGQRNLQESIVQQNVLFAQEVDTATHVFETPVTRPARSGRPTLEKYGECSIEGQVMLTREPS